MPLPEPAAAPPAAAVQPAVLPAVLPTAAEQAAVDPAQRALAAPLLTDFTARLKAAAPVTALWVHGSLALGDYRHGRSDLDLIAVLPTAPDARLRGELTELHRRLIAEQPGGEKLHCTYLPQGDLADPAADHFTFAQGEPMDRPVTPVTRRELLDGGLRLAGGAPAGLLPPVGDRDLHAHLRADLRTFWYPVTDRPGPWRRDIWVDLGPITAARATVALRENRLITKREAIAGLPALGAPPALVADIAARRYGTPAPLTVGQRDRRAEQARLFTRTAIERALR
ncbi:nucleotidyltransferase domain-containing protein [Kitasatospora sp. NPDC059646]|uniref:nucleotidyltransferase domain-containing protein n=1 Tax=Kitasatospora sp. NPDC059646 TaxID=3346893 RepID=UPI0036848CAA